MDDRGQALSLEALLAGMIIVTAVTLAFGVTVVSEDSLGQAREPYNESQTSLEAHSALKVSANNGELRKTLLYWDDSNTEFHNTDSQDYYTTQQPPTKFGTLIENSLVEGSRNVNIQLIYWDDTDGDGELEQATQRLVYTGDPSASATTASYTTTLYDSDRLYASDGTETNTEIEDTAFYAPDISSTELYNVVTVRVIVW